jgi:hypothetical protein
MENEQHEKERRTYTYQETTLFDERERERYIDKEERKGGRTKHNK